MRCPMCLGKGYATDEDIKEYPHRCPNCDGKGFYYVDWQKVRCEVCNGSGKKPMTNEEYLRSCTTEQLAKWIAKCIKDTINLTNGNRKYTDNIVSEKWWVEWLKQPHTFE